MREQTLEKKQAIIDEIADNIENSKSMVVVEYRGLSVSDVTELRKNYREKDVVYKVYKNTFLKRAFKQANIEDDRLEELLTGPNAIAFSMDEVVDAAKVSNDFSKDHEELVIKFGYVDGKLIGKDEVERLAKLPSKETLIAQTLGSLNAPISGLANVLQGTIRNVVYALNAVKEKKEEEAA